MKKTFLLLTSMLAIAMISCKKSSLSDRREKEQNANAAPPPIGTGPTFFPIWFRIADNLQDRENGFGFAIGSKGYVAGGYGLNANATSQSLRDLEQYDPSTNTWTKKADLPGFTTQGAVSFVIDNKAYISTGYHLYKGTDPNLSSRYLKDTWQYDPATDQWTKKADFPGGARRAAVGMSINGKGYVGLGRTEVSIFGNLVEVQLSDWWQYDPLTDTWTKKKNFPGGGRSSAAGCAAGSFGYVGTGSMPMGQFLNDWWQYDPSTDTWAQKANFPGPGRADAMAFTSTSLAGPKAWIAIGEDPNSPAQYGYTDVWQYDPATNQWNQSVSMPFDRSGAACFVVNNTVYIGSGIHGAYGTIPAGYSTVDFWGFHLY